MTWIRKGCWCGCVVAFMATTGFSQNIFLVELDGGASQTHLTGTDETVFMAVGETITVGIYLTDGVSNTPINAYQWQNPCAATPLDGATGAVDYVDPSILVNRFREDFILLGFSGFTDPDFGNCPAGGTPIGNPRLGVTPFPFPDPRLVGVSPAVYLGEFALTVTSGVSGEQYSFAVNCVPTDLCDPEWVATTFLRDENHSGEPYTAMTKDRLIIEIVECSVSTDCDDLDVCTFDACADGQCSHDFTVYGDVNGMGVVDLDDILCVLAGFEALGNCPNADIWPSCTGNGLIDMDDILSVIAAFGGADPCCGGG